MLMSLVVASFRIKSFGESYFIRRFIFLKVFARHSVVIIISIRVIIIILANTELQHSKFYVFIVKINNFVNFILLLAILFILHPPATIILNLFVNCCDSAILKHLFICIINKLLWSLISVSFICSIYLIYFTGKCIRN